MLLRLLSFRASLLSSKNDWTSLSRQLSTVPGNELVKCALLDNAALRNDNDVIDWV